jgi:alpha-amylase/alpha-mannosidase (GH57 family)
MTRMITDREAFETWARPRRYDPMPNATWAFSWVQDSLGVWQEVSCMWEAWQAATLAERERCAKVADSAWRNGFNALDIATAIRKGPTP